MYIEDLMSTACTLAYTHVIVCPNGDPSCLYYSMSMKLVKSFEGM